MNAHRCLWFVDGQKSNLSNRCTSLFSRFQKGGHSPVLNPRGHIIDRVGKLLFGGQRPCGISGTPSRAEGAFRVEILFALERFSDGHDDLIANKSRLLRKALQLFDRGKAPQYPVNGCRY